MFSRVFCTMLTLLVMTSTPLFAQEWEKLGTRVANFKGEKDVIAVSSPSKFSAIKFQVENAGLRMYNVVVTFANGDKFSPQTQLTFLRKQRSRVIDLPGNARTITKVAFFYQTKMNRKGNKAVINLYGKKAGSGEATVQKVKWEKLGSRRVNFVGDKDVIGVGAVEGRFDALRFEVQGGNLEMYDIRVHFKNGEVFSPQTRFGFKEGEHSRLLDLPGNKRFIEKIVFFYRSRLKKGHATLTVYGRHIKTVTKVNSNNPPTSQPKVPSFPNWKHLGSRKVSFGAEKDVINLTGKARYQSLRIIVTGSALEMYNIKVTFGNGQQVSPDTRLIFKEGSTSREIDLPGKRRIITRIAFVYRSLQPNKTGKAHIHVYGKK